MKTYEAGYILDANVLFDGIYELVIKTKIAECAMPGQFVMVYPQNSSTLLPRPISICEVLKEKEAIRLVYRVVGKGTKEFSELSEGKIIKLLGPIGNGFPLDKVKGKKAILIGGGIGVPPILELSKALKDENPIALLGYRDSNMFLKDDFDKYVKTVIATEDGSVGITGNVCDALNDLDLPCDVIFACGPMPMLQALKRYAEAKNITAYISLEERMACGVGACLGCVCKTVKKDGHSHVNNARVCTEGPVFEASEVEI